MLVKPGAACVTYCQATASTKRSKPSASQKIASYASTPKRGTMFQATIQGSAVATDDAASHKPLMMTTVNGFDEDALCSRGLMLLDLSSWGCDGRSCRIGCL